MWARRRAYRSRRSTRSSRSSRAAPMARTSWNLVAFFRASPGISDDRHGPRPRSSQSPFTPRDSHNRDRKTALGSAPRRYRRTDSGQTPPARARPSVPARIQSARSRSVNADDGGWDAGVAIRRARRVVSPVPARVGRRERRSPGPRRERPTRFFQLSRSAVLPPSAPYASKMTPWMTSTLTGSIWSWKNFTISLVFSRVWRVASRSSSVSPTGGPLTA